MDEFGRYFRSLKTLSTKMKGRLYACSELARFNESTRTSAFKSSY